jgi:hypothetical protein
MRQRLALNAIEDSPFAHADFLDLHKPLDAEYAELESFANPAELRREPNLFYATNNIWRIWQSPAISSVGFVLALQKVNFICQNALN